MAIREMHKKTRNEISLHTYHNDYNKSNDQMKTWQRGQETEWVNILLVEGKKDDVIKHTMQLLYDLQFLSWLLILKIVKQKPAFTEKTHVWMCISHFTVLSKN